MADTNLEGQGESDPRVERGFDRRIIWAMVAAGIVFVIVFIILAFRGFSPANTPTGTNSGSQQQTGTQSNR